MAQFSHEKMVKFQSMLEDFQEYSDPNLLLA